MFIRMLKNEKGALYPISLVFFMSALILLSHSLALYTVHYKTYDGPKSNKPLI